jgi:hypothetical protein
MNNQQAALRVLLRHPGIFEAMFLFFHYFELLCNFFDSVRCKEDVLRGKFLSQRIEIFGFLRK